MIGPNTTISVKRKTTTAGKTSYPSTFIFENLSAYMEQVSPTIAPLFNAQSAFETWLFFTERVDIRAGDRIFDDEDVEYKVEGVQPFKNPEIPDHIEITTKKIYND